MQRDLSLRQRRLEDIPTEELHMPDLPLRSPAIRNQRKIWSFLLLADSFKTEKGYTLTI
jgi:hypothetical protein